MPMVDPEFQMDKRTTSAGYRLPITSRPRSSEFHQNCVPAAVKQRAQAAAAPSTKASSEAAPADVVTEDKIWKQSVKKERTGAKQWYANFRSVNRKLGKLLKDECYKNSCHNFVDACSLEKHFFNFHLKYNFIKKIKKQ